MLSSNRFLIKTGKDKKELYYVTLTFNRTLDKVYRLEPLRKVMYNKISEV